MTRVEVLQLQHELFGHSDFLPQICLKIMSSIRGTSDTWYSDQLLHERLFRGL